MAHTCTWVLRPAEPGRAAQYCGLSVSYSMQLDDDGRKIRKYSSLCQAHQQQEKKTQADEE